MLSIDSSVSKQIFAMILIGIALHLHSHLGRSMAILLVKESTDHAVFLPTDVMCLPGSSLHAFLMVLRVSAYRFSPFLLDFYLSAFFMSSCKCYSIFNFGALYQYIEMQLIVFTFMLYPVTLMNSFISSTRLFSSPSFFQQIPWDFTHSQSHHLQKDQFCFFLSSISGFNFISLLSALARTSSILFNKNGENRHPCLLSDLVSKHSFFSPLNIMLTVGYFCRCSLPN